MQGVIVLDKPTGIGSNAALMRIKRALKVAKIGFVGTLDPLASGVLPVFVGKATKLISAFEMQEKTYRVSIKLGECTDTLDAQGEIIRSRELGNLDAERVQEVLLAFEGQTEQETPTFSAVKVNGVPAYRRARRGEKVILPRRKVRFFDMEIQSIQLPHVVFKVACSKGAYMRQLATDAGEVLGVGAHITALRRLHCGGLFNLENSITLETLERVAQRDDWRFLRNPSEFMPDFFSMVVSREGEDELRQGRAIPMDAARQGDLSPERVMALRAGGELIAVGRAVQRGPDRLMFQPGKVLL